MFSRISSTILFLAALLFVTGVFTGHAFSQKLSNIQGKLNKQNDFFYSLNKKTSLTVSKNEIGILAKNKSNKSRIDVMISRYELTLVKSYSDRIYVYSLPKSSARAEIAEIARQIKAENKEEVKQAGLVAMPAGAAAPFIVTDEFIAQFKPNVSRGEIDSFNKDNNVEVIEENRFVKNQFLLRVKEGSNSDALGLANFYHTSGKTTYAHPNFLHVTEFRGAFLPDDPLFINQWHHDNTGQGGGTIDADVDTPLAWDLTLGNNLIAVIDDGIEITHEDLAPNGWVNTGEIPGNGIDDEGNGFADDVNGYDFADNDPDPGPEDSEDHGTAVAGVAVARGDNALGVSGSCPDCSLMALRVGNYDYYYDTQAFYYAKSMGASIITNSWGFPIGTPELQSLVDAINDAALNGRGGLGSVVLFAMNNSNVNDCTGSTPDISSLQNVIAVSRSTNLDRFGNSGFGNCMDVLAPTRGTGAFGTLGITTTDRTGANGYGAGNYFDGFNGTSSATPLAAGVVGLILSADPLMSREQVQRLLQDTTDKIEDSLGSYAEATGFSSPASGHATHGYGRINALEAVRIAAPASMGGKAGVDAFFRDNRLDWGNTEQPSNTLFEPTRDFIPHWRSVDIKVDAPPYQPAPANNDDFEAFTHENAQSGQLNKVYVRVRNRGPVTANSVTVKLHWAYAGAGLPALPGDFWSAFPADSSDVATWHPLGSDVADIPYSGSSLANTDFDASQILGFDFNGPPVPVPGSPGEDPSHFCLFAVLDGEQDRVSPKSRPTVAEDFIPDWLTPIDNNVTHRNITVEPAGEIAHHELLIVSNPFPKEAKVTVSFAVPKGWAIKSGQVTPGIPFTLASLEQRKITLEIDKGNDKTGELNVIQKTEADGKTVFGGMTYISEPKKKRPPRRKCCQCRR